jgi:type VI secretion system secreted protein VgrG
MKAATYKQANRPLQLTTPLGPDALYLVGFDGREGLSRLFHFQLDLLADNGRAIAFDKLLGQPVTISLAVGAGRSRFFNGIVSRFSQGMRDDTFTHYRAEVVPQLWLLTRRVQCRIFQHQAVPDILKEMFQGLRVRFELQGTFHPRNYCVQYRESDFAFASRLMEEEGIFYFFQHAADGHVMVVANTRDSHPEVPEQSAVIFDEIEGGNRPEYRVFEWEKVQEVRSGRVTLWDHSFELPNKHLESRRPVAEGVPVGQVTHPLKLAGSEQREIFDYPGGYARRFDGIDPGGAARPTEHTRLFEDGPRTAAIRMEEETTPALRTSGAGNCRQFVSGHQFSLSRHFNADGTYALTEVEHHCRLGDDYRSGDGVRLDYRNRFTCIPLALPFRPARVTPKPRVEGAQTAVVVGPPGEELYTDKFGRVKVQFHWDREGQNDADSSCWIRVAQPAAGKRWGTYFWPRIGQEVIVHFLEGDPDRPIILGSVYNADQMPPYLGDGPDPKHPNDRKVSGIKTCSTPGGEGYNELRFDDTKGKEQIFIHAQKDLEIRAENTIKINTMGNCWHLTTGCTPDGKPPQGDCYIEVNKDAHQNVKGESRTMVGGEESHIVNGNAYHSYGGSRRTGVAGEEIVEATTILFDAAAICFKAGGSFIKIDAQGVTIVGAEVLINSGGDALKSTTPGAGVDASNKPVRLQDQVKKPIAPQPADQSKSGAPSTPPASPPKGNSAAPVPKPSRTPAPDHF